MSEPTHYIGLHDIGNTGNCRKNLSQPKYVATLQERFMMEAASAAHGNGAPPQDEKGGAAAWSWSTRSWWGRRST